ncbi:MAG: DUF302 domain-containing protein [Halarcobacter sp.]
MQYIVESKKSVDEVVDAIQEKISEYKFGILHIHEISNILKSKGLEFKNECRVLEVCNPNYAKTLLDEDMKLAVILPCKIAVYTQEGKTNISINSLTQLVDDINPDMLELAQEIQDTLLELISICR